MIGRTISHYTILEKLGEGGMGVVYKAQDLSLDRHVALKFLPPHLRADHQAKKRFIHEAKAASALEHNHICAIYEIDETPDGQTYIVMPCYEGETLRERLEQGPLEIDEALEITSQVTSGLSKAHEKEIVHRDIKPGNVFITTDNVAKIVDFGLAKLATQTRLTKTGATVGTVMYMSPEQAKGDEVDHRTDIWSLGVMLYELLTGKLPFRGEIEQAVVYSIMNEDPQPLTSIRKDVPVEIEAIIEKALEKYPEKRYQRVDEFLTELDEQRDRLALGIKRRRLPLLRKRTRRRLVQAVGSAAVVAAVVFSYLILKPGPSPEVIAQENSMAIMYFENIADPEDEDKAAEIVTRLLTTALSESDYMNVVSQQRLYDILKRLGRQDERVVDRDVVPEVAKRAGVNWVLTGSVLQTKPNVVLQSVISNPTTGAIRASQEVRGEVGEDEFKVTDKLIQEIIADLALPKEARRGFDWAMADVTTHSREAYRHYIEGLEHRRKFSWEMATNSLEKAIEHDSTFAMAYAELARMKWNLGYGDEGRRLIAEAAKYSDNLPQKEQFEIGFLQSFFDRRYGDAVASIAEVLERDPTDKKSWFSLGFLHGHIMGHHSEATRCFEKVIELDPLETRGYNMLAYFYAQVGDFDRSVWAINKYIELAPDEANAYGTQGDLYARRGRLDDALESLQKAVELEPSAYYWAGIGNMYLFKRDYARADSVYELIIQNNEARYGRFYLTYIPVYQGKLRPALAALEDAIAADRSEASDDYSKHVLKALVHMDLGQLDLALEEVETAIELTNTHPASFRDLQACLLALGDRISEAEEIVEALRVDIEEKDPPRMWAYWWPRGVIELAKGNADTAVVHLEKAVTNAPLINDLPHYAETILPGPYVRFFLAKAYLEAGKLAKAASQLETLVTWCDNDGAVFALWTIRAHYLLGMTYEKSGWTDKAIEQYEEFVEIWKDADPELTEVEDARQRLARLKSSP